MAMQRGNIKEEHRGSESHMKQWSVVICCRGCVCVYTVIIVSLLGLNLADSYFLSAH